MGKNLFKVIAIMAATMVLSLQCSVREELVPDSSAGPVRTVTISISAAEPHVSEDPATRTALADGYRVIWQEGDYVYINGSRYPVIPDPEDPARATVENVPESQEYAAYFGDGWHEGDNMDIAYNSRMYYAENSFGRISNPMFAYSTTPVLQFRNLCGILRLAVTGTGELRSIAFTPDSPDDYLSGTFSVDLNEIRENGIPESFEFVRYSEEDSYDSAIWEYYPGDEGSGPIRLGAEPAYFYFVLPPRTYDGFTVTMTDMEGNVAMKHMGAPVEIGRSKIVPMKPFEFEPVEKPEITILGTEGLSIRYQVKARPGSWIRTGVVYADIYDSFPEADLDDESSLEMVNRYTYAYCSLLEPVGGVPVQVGDDGTYTFTADHVYNINMDENIPMSAGSGYYVTAAYSDRGYYIFGVPVISDREEIEAVGGEGPGIVIQIDESSPYYLVRAILSSPSSDVKGVSVCIIPNQEYDRYIAQGLDDRNILQLRADVLEDITGIHSAISYEVDAVPSCEYVILAMAADENGAESMSKEIWTTPGYLPENPQWELISDGKTSMDIYTYMSEESLDCRLTGLSAYKMTGSGTDGDIYRIDCNFSETGDLATFWESSGLVLSGNGSESLYLVVRERVDEYGNVYENVYFFPEEYYTGFSHGGNPVYLGEGRGSVSTYEADLSLFLSSYLTTDWTDDYLYLGSVSMRINIDLPGGMTGGETGNENFEEDEPQPWE